MTAGLNLRTVNFQHAVLFRFLLITFAGMCVAPCAITSEESAFSIVFNTFVPKIQSVCPARIPIKYDPFCLRCPYLHWDMFEVSWVLQLSSMDFEMVLFVRPYMRSRSRTPMSMTAYFRRNLTPRIRRLARPTSTIIHQVRTECKLDITIRCTGYLRGMLGGV